MSAILNVKIILDESIDLAAIRLAEIGKSKSVFWQRGTARMMDQFKEAIDKGFEQLAEYEQLAEHKWKTGG